jgi:transcriptional regulator with XRE-family HTH domain
MAWSANPIDIHVGRRLRQRRNLVGLGQDALAKALDLSFQQIQKNEKGANRIGASRIYELSLLLGVEPNYFFEDVPAPVQDEIRTRLAGNIPSEHLHALQRRNQHASVLESDARRIAEAWLRLPSDEARKLAQEFIHYFLVPRGNSHRDG